jgi:predicted transposase/invertase (TIGR01784 family)
MKDLLLPHAYSDMVFKYLFGREESKEQLKGFINAVLEHGGHHPITELHIRNPYNLKEFNDDKLSILDLRATDDRGRTFNLEIQSCGHRDFANRSLYYWSRIYSSQIKEGQNYEELKPVISINLLNFILFKENEKFHNIFTLKERDDPTIELGDHLLINYLELPKLKAEKKETSLVNWLQYFLHEGKEANVVKSIFERDRLIAKVHEDYEKFMADEKLRIKALSREIGQMDHYARMSQAKDEGLEQGIEQGIEQGLEQGIEQGLEKGLKKGIKQGLEQGKLEGKEEDARNALSLGLDIETIEKLTGLPMERLKELREE